MNPLVCPCGCALAPTLKLEVLCGRLKKAMPGVDFIGGIECDAVAPVTRNNVIVLQTIGGEGSWEVANTLRVLSQTHLKLNVVVHENKIVVNTSPFAEKGVFYADATNIG